jgi:hypothetical protein
MAGLLEYTKNGQVTEPPLYRFMRGNVQSFLNSIPDPSKMTPEQQLAMGLNANPIMGLLGTTAYHGSPYLFDKFNVNKVGSGEGAQAYGHGMYFAENPKVAEEYRNALKFDNDLKITTNGDVVTQKALSMSNMDKDKAISMLKSGQVDNVKMPESFANYMVENTFAKMQNPSGTLYKVDIPDEYIPNLLQWDKPLSQQTTKVKQALEKIDPDTYSPKGTDYSPDELGQSIYLRIANSPQAQGYQQASSLLDSLGVKGIKYLDQGSRTGQAGTNNFVIFDPSNVKILERNNKGLLK